MSVFAEHWSALTAALHEAAGADRQAPPPRPFDGALPKWTKFQRFDTALTAEAMGDPDTALALAACIDYREGTLWVECVFDAEGRDSHAFDVLRSTDEHGAADSGEFLRWDVKGSQQRAMLRLVDHGAAALPPEVAATMAIDGLKRLEAALGEIGRAHV